MARSGGKFLRRFTQTLMFTRRTFRHRFPHEFPMKLSAYRFAIALAATLSLHADELAPVGPNIRPLAAKPGARPFTYVEAPDKLPNYLAGEKWGTQGQAITQMQAPMSPEQSLTRLVVQPGFTTSLFAAEPDITKPIALAWDERGRLWVAETVDYPNEQQPEGQGRDRIKICEDTNGDGKADKFTVFADKLSIPTSLCFGNGGLIVIEGGHTLFLKDTDGDDRADERKVLFSGWNMGDTHATASNLRYGLDNWIWGTVGYSGFDGEVGGKNVKFGMGVFRFKPDGSALEFIRSSNNNTWGLGLTEDGVVLGSTANGNADPQPLLRGGQRLELEPHGNRGGHPGHLPGDRESPPGGLAQQILRRRRLGALHGPGVPGGILEPNLVRLRTDRPPHRLVPLGTPRRGFQGGEPRQLPRQRRRMDRADRRRGRPRRRPLGARLV
jgi:hypothetical protein